MRQLGNDVNGWSDNVRISAKAVKEESVASSSVKSHGGWDLENMS